MSKTNAEEKQYKKKSKGAAHISLRYLSISFTTEEQVPNDNHKTHDEVLNKQSN